MGVYDNSLYLERTFACLDERDPEGRSDPDLEWAFACLDERDSHGTTVTVPASVLIAHDGRYRVLCINGTRVARYTADEQANEAARLARGSLSVGLGVPWGLLPQPLAWLGAPRLEDEPDAAA